MYEGGIMNNYNYQPSNIIQFGGYGQQPIPYFSQPIMNEPVYYDGTPQSLPEHYVRPYNVHKPTLQEYYNPFPHLHGGDPNYSQNGTQANVYSYMQPNYQYQQQQYYPNQGYRYNMPTSNYGEGSKFYDEYVNGYRAVIGGMCKANGGEVNQEVFDRMFYPNRYARENQRKMTEAQRLNEQNWNICMQYMRYGVPTNGTHIMSQTQLNIYARELADKRWAESIKDHSLWQFFNQDLWKWAYEEWKAENLVDNSHDMSRTYDSEAYNQLLQIHYEREHPEAAAQMQEQEQQERPTDGAGNPLVEDVPMGIGNTIDAINRRRNLLEGKVPKFVSTPAIQEKRRRFMNALAEQIKERDRQRSLARGFPK